MLSINIRHRVSPSFAINVQLESSSCQIGLTGPSGSGKTTLLHLIAGIVSADHETICVQEETLSGLTPQKRRIGLSMQSPHLFPHMTVRENLLVGHEFEPSSPGLDSVVDWLEITHILDRSPRHLSGGECQRVAMGRALMRHPRLLLLDEPFSAVDDARTKRITHHLKEHLKRQDIAMIIISHDVGVLDTTVSEIATIEAGSVVRAQSQLP